MYQTRRASSQMHIMNYRVSKNRTVFGPQNFVKNIRRKANDMSKFSELCLI